MEYKVIFHIDENARWQMLLGNVENLLAASESGHMTVEVLANGEAVQKYASSILGNGNDSDQSLTAKMASLHREGVTFAACRNAMRANHLTEHDLHPFVVTVPAGVMELVTRQAQGYAYIKP